MSASEEDIRKDEIMRTAIIMGSTSDLSKVEPAVAILKDYGVTVDVRCLSAHRAHAGLSEFIEETNQNGTEVIITAAGMAAALPGVCAALFALPVIGVPLSGKNLDGMDAVFSIMQMPPGVPVATVAIDGAKNAAILAAKILAAGDDAILEKIKKYTADMKAQVVAKDAKLKQVGYKQYLAEK